MDLAEKLLLIAARRSTETVFGWSHPDCIALQEAAQQLRGEPPVQPEIVDAVLS